MSVRSLIGCRQAASVMPVAIGSRWRARGAVDVWRLVVQVAGGAVGVLAPGGSEPVVAGLAADRGGDDLRSAVQDQERSPAPCPAPRFWRQGRHASRRTGPRAICMPGRAPNRWGSCPSVRWRSRVGPASDSARRMARGLVAWTERNDLVPRRAESPGVHLVRLRRRQGDAVFLRRVGVTFRRRCLPGRGVCLLMPFTRIVTVAHGPRAV